MVNILALILQFHAFHSFSSRLVVSVDFCFSMVLG